jgi:hypothetical protein
MNVPVPQWPEKPTKDLPLPLAMRPKVAARAIGVCERTLWSLTQRGEIPHARIGSAVIYPTAAVMKWLDEITTHPPVRRPEDAAGGDA